MSKKIKILSIDGGGIRGIIPAVILVEVEKLLREKLNRPHDNLGDFFDFLAGTSTGGILTSLYLAPGENSKAKYSAKDALDLYLEHGNSIFNCSLIQKIESVGGLAHGKYSNAHLSNLLNTYLGDTRLSECIKPCLIPAYAITERRAFFFTSNDAKRTTTFDFYLRDVARATAAAPTYFEPALVTSFDGEKIALCDGGVYANNPALCAYAEVRKLQFLTTTGVQLNFPTAKDMLIFSLGTGSVKKPYHYRNFQHAGELKWLEPIIDILMSGNAETVDYQLHQMFGTLAPEDQQDYIRIEPPLFEASSEMDNASADNIERLKQAGLAFIADNLNLLEKWVDRIVYCSTATPALT